MAECMELGREFREKADEGPWWFDGRDIFHKKPGTNIDQIIVPLGQVVGETLTPDGAVCVATAKLMALAPELLAYAEQLTEALRRETRGSGIAYCLGGIARCNGCTNHCGLVEHNEFVAELD